MLVLNDARALGVPCKVKLLFAASVAGFFFCRMAAKPEDDPVKKVVADIKNRQIRSFRPDQPEVPAVAEPLNLAPSAFVGRQRAVQEYLDNREKTFPKASTPSPQSPLGIGASKRR